MPDFTFSYTALADVNPYTSTSFSRPTGSANARITSGRFVSVDATNAVQLYNTAPLQSAEIACTVVIGEFTGDASASRGAAIMADNGDGYFILIRSTDLRVYRTTAGGGANTLTQIGTTTSITAVDNDVFLLGYTKSTGALRVTQGGVSRFTATDLTHAAATLKVGPLSRATLGRIKSVTILNVADPQTITSINSGNPVAVGQTGVVIAHTGFTGAATSVTTNRAGVTCTITAGDANSTTVSVSGWVEGGPYPVVDNTVTFTVSRAGESASATQTLTRPANWDQQAFSGAILDDQNLIGFNLAAAGHTVNGGTFYYKTNQVSSLTVNADTSWTAAPAGGTFDAVFIPSAGATAGNAYLFEITVLNGSIVVVTGGGLTSIGLTAIGLGVIGLAAIGFGSGGQSGGQSGPTSLLFDDTQLLDSTQLED